MRAAQSKGTRILKTPRTRVSGSHFFGAAALTVALLLVIGAAFAASLNVRRLRSSFDWVERTQQVLLQVSEIDSSLASAISAQRGYLLTGAADQKAAFYRFRTELGSQLTVLAQLVSDPGQLQRVEALRPLIEERLYWLELTISRHAAPGPGTEPATPTGQELQARTAIRDVLRQFRDAEVSLLNKRQRQAEWDSTISSGFAVATIVLALGSAALGVFLLQRERERSRVRELQAELLHVSRLNSVGQTASMLAHEVNQPLTAARNFLGAAQRMLDAPPVEPARIVDAVQRSMTQVDRATEIVRRLRRFVRRSAPEQSTEPVDAVINEAIAISALQRADTQIVQQIAPGLPLASIDRVQIQQVLVNLMRNALEAMADSERKELTIAACRQDRDAILVSVRDTGPGLPAVVAARLFQPFVTTKTDGMGVGLSICRTIVEAHGGRIWAEPGAAGGAVFHFTIPTAAGSDAAAAHRADPAAAVASARARPVGRALDEGRPV